MLRLILLLALTIQPHAAHPGAWTLAEGDGQLIMTTGRKTAPARAMVRGIPDRDTTSVYVFVEYGVTNRLTLGGKASGEWVTTPGALDLRLGGHARYRLWQGKAGDVLSVQLGGSGPIQALFGDPLGGGTFDNVAEADASLLYGRGWISDWGNSFVSVEAGFRWRGGDRPDEIRLETTAGHAFSRRFMGIFGTYGAYPIGGGADASLKLSPSIAWTMWPRLGPNDKKPADFKHPSTLQIGVNYDVLNADDGLGFYVSVWNKF